LTSWRFKALSITKASKKESEVDAPRYAGIMKYTQILHPYELCFLGVLKILNKKMEKDQADESTKIEK